MHGSAQNKTAQWRGTLAAWATGTLAKGQSPPHPAMRPAKTVDEDQTRAADRRQDALAPDLPYFLPMTLPSWLIRLAPLVSH